MRCLTQTTFGAVFRAEVLFNSRRIAPYLMMILFAANAVLWWGWGPGVRLGWATNSDYYIVRNLQGFSFLLGLPIFNAVLMGDPVIRDFRFGIDPLIFSKPVSRAEYLLGKFLGNFFVLVCCQMVFPLTLLVLQATRTSQMIVQPFKVLPYFKHFFFFVVISHLIFAAIYFTVGTLTRNAKMVYGLAVCFYPLYISYQVLVLKGFAPRWGILLDPFLLKSGPGGGGFTYTADFLNRYVFSYSRDMIANRMLVIVAAFVCLAILYLRFTISERSRSIEEFTTLNLSQALANTHQDPDTLLAPGSDRVDQHESPRKVASNLAPLPYVFRLDQGIRANINKLLAALIVELRLLRSERSLVVLFPLAVCFSTLEVAFYDVVPDISYSASYATSTAKALLLFLVGMTVFYAGEAMHRDREVRIEPVIWATPARTNVLLLSKFLATLSLTLSLIVLVGLTAILVQLIRGHTPLEIQALLLIYSVILLPGTILLTGASVLLNVLFRDKYLVYAVSIGTGAGMFYLFSQGYNHWLYNPLLYQLWTYADLSGAGPNHFKILVHGLYCLAIAGGCLSVAHLIFERKSSRGWRDGARLTGIGWSILVSVVSVAVAIGAGLIIGASR